MKKEEFTNGIENFIIEEVAKHCKEVGKCANKILQDESLKKSISTILGNVDALYFKISNSTFEHKGESEKMKYKLLEEPKITYVNPQKRVPKVLIRKKRIELAKKYIESIEHQNKHLQNH